MRADIDRIWLARREPILRSIHARRVRDVYVYGWPFRAISRGIVACTRQQLTPTPPSSHRWSGSARAASSSAAAVAAALLGHFHPTSPHLRRVVVRRYGDGCHTSTRPGSAGMAAVAAGRSSSSSGPPPPPPPSPPPPSSPPPPPPSRRRRAAVRCRCRCRRCHRATPCRRVAAVAAWPARAARQGAAAAAIAARACRAVRAACAAVPAASRLPCRRRGDAPYGPNEPQSPLGQLGYMPGWSGGLFLANFCNRLSNSSKTRFASKTLKSHSATWSAPVRAH